MLCYSYLITFIIHAYNCYIDEHITVSKVSKNRAMSIFPFVSKEDRRHRNENTLSRILFAAILSYLTVDVYTSYGDTAFSWRLEQNSCCRLRILQVGILQVFTKFAG